MLDGVEWNVRSQRSATPQSAGQVPGDVRRLLERPEFESYDPERDRDRLDDALARGEGRSRAQIESPSAWSASRCVPTPTSRRCSTRSTSNVSCTTATAISSSPRPAPERRSSPRSTTAAWSRRPAAGSRLLFVAHRQEILEQSMRTYREVLADGDFGELYVGGARPERWKHVFASVQSLTSYGVANIPADAYDVVVIDEFHHAEATTYRRILDHLQPAGAARPDRDTGARRRRRMSARFFDGRTAAELRLWDALGADLLVPVPLLRHRRRDGPSSDHVEPRTLRRGSSSPTSTRATTLELAIVLTQVRDKIANVGEHASPGLLRQRRARRVHGSRLQRCRHPSAGRERRHPERCPRIGSTAATDRRGQRPLHRRCVQRRPGHPRRRHRAVSSTHRERDDLPAAAGPRPATHSRKAVLTVLDFVGYHRKEFHFVAQVWCPDGHPRQATLRRQ